MDKQTFIDNMTERGYEPRLIRNGNITATKGDATVRFVPLADYIVHIDTPTVTAIVRDGRGDVQDNRLADRLTIRPRRHTCGFESRRGTRHVGQPIKGQRPQWPTEPQTVDKSSGVSHSTP
jgi:hypothetical protein